MKRLLLFALTFTALMLSSQLGFCQPRFHIDTIRGLHKPFILKDTVRAEIRLRNTGNKDFHGKIYFWIKSTYHQKPKRIDSTKTDIVLERKDTIPIKVSFKIDPSDFKENVSNIVVVWPTGAGVTFVDTIQTMVKIVSKLAIEDEQEPLNYLRFYPNPSDGIIHWDYLTPGILIKSVQVLDVAGKELMNGDGRLDYLDLSALPPSMYFLKVGYSDGTIGSYRILISH